MRLLSFVCVAAIEVLGVWIAGAVLTNDFRTSIALTTAWFGVSGAACLLVALRRRALRIPVLSAYALTAAVVGGYLGLTRHKAPRRTRAGAKRRGSGPKKVTPSPTIPRRGTRPAKPAPTPAPTVAPTVAPEPSIEPVRRHGPWPVGQVEVAP